ncbi:MAG: InlB B-repeat-containing protein [Clostridia bacterium]|nr:InlB B-repeat-containing protein [Clostridia bacterium]
MADKKKPDVSAIIAIVVAIVGFLAIYAGVLFACGVFGNNTPDDNTDKITVTIEVNGGTGTYNNMTFVLDENNSYTFTDEEKAALRDALKRDGYELKGLSTTPDGEGGWTVTIPKDAESPVKLYAIWEEEEPLLPQEDKYTITFDMHDHGTAPADITDATALPAELPEVEDVDGWLFAGWYLDENFETPAEAGATIIEDTTLHALWVQIPIPPHPDFNITFDMHGHGDAPADIIDTETLPAELPTVEDVDGWTFVGWYLDENFETPAEAGAIINDDTTLHAKWEQASRPVKPGYTITFDMHGHGTAPADISNAIMLPAELPEVEDVDGWGFAGWYLDEDFETPAEAGAFISGDTTLHANWIKCIPLPPPIS